MAIFEITVSDTRKKYAPKTYRVEESSMIMAYGKATEQYIKDNNHPPRKETQRGSAYYARFWNEGKEVV